MAMAINSLKLLRGLRNYATVRLLIPTTLSRNYSNETISRKGRLADKVAVITASTAG